MGKVSIQRDNLENRKTHYEKIDRRHFTQNFGKKVLGEGYKGESVLPPFRYISGTVKKIMVYETIQKDESENKKKKDEILTKEERINLIRYGPNAT